MRLKTSVSIRPTRERWTIIHSYTGASAAFDHFRVLFRCVYGPAYSADIPWADLTVRSFGL